MSKQFAAALIAVALIIGVGFGYYLTPEYANLKSAPSHEGLGAPDKFLNLRYINGMIAHHMSAIDMLENVKAKSERKELKDLADAVIKLDTQGIADLYALKKDMYGDERKVSKFTAFNLGEADDKFDLRFLNAMIIHHDQAIANSMEALTKSYDGRILDIGGAVINLLSGNKEQLVKWRSDWYNIK